jgi:hypothetical protein
VTALLDGVELPLAQCIDAEDVQVVVRHAVPGLDGGVLQRTGRRAARVAVTGVVAGADALGRLETLRDRVRGADPVDFVADVATAVRVTRVRVEALDVREVAGKPERWEYAFLLREHQDPPPVMETDPPEPAAVQTAAVDDGRAAAAEQAGGVDAGTGELVVQVTLADGGADYTGVRVLVEGTTESGEALSFSIDEHDNGAFRREGLPAGEYTVHVASA